MAYKITYCSDIEGHWDYFCAWAAINPIVSMSDDELFFINKLDEQGLDASGQANYFVFGGDASDRGPGDLRIITALVNFKKRHPSQVFILLGNRDLKYLRIPLELNPKFIAWQLKKTIYPWFGAKLSPAHFLKDYLAKHNLTAKELSVQQMQIIYLQWMLSCTMGSAKTFEYRRQELALLANTELTKISEEDVLTSFIDELKPAGIIYKFISLGQLHVIIGDKLFIHGAITPNNFGVIPGKGKCYTDLRVWLQALEEWFAFELQAWKQSLLTQDKLHLVPEIGANDIHRYCIFNSTSIVTQNWYTYGDLKPLNAAIVAKMLDANIHYAITGHQPVRDIPLLIRAKDFAVVVIDNNYADRTSVTTRANSLNTLIITLDNIHINYLNKFGAKFCIDFKLDKRIGCFLKNDWILSAKIDDCFIIRKKESANFDFKERCIDAQQLADLSI